MPKVAVILANGFEEISLDGRRRRAPRRYHLPYGRI